jgi:hypothetical protein
MNWKNRVGEWKMRAYSEDLSESGEHAQAPKESANLRAALSEALEDANCKAVQRGVTTSGEGRNASDRSKNEGRWREVECDKRV